MTETIRYSLIGLEDLSLGSASFEALLADGRAATISQINQTNLPTTFTAGSIPFVNATGFFAEDNTNLFFDDTNNRVRTPNVAGGTSASGTITILGTTHNTPGNVLLNSSGGNVGIGTTTVDELLHVANSAGDAFIQIENEHATSTGDPAIKFVINGTTKFTVGVDDSDSDHFKIATTALGTSDRVIITAAGNVGIGAATPSRLFAVQQSSAGTDTYAAIIAGTADQSILALGDTGDDDVGKIAYDHAADRMEFFTGAAVRVKIQAGELIVGDDTASGDVTIGHVIHQATNTDAFLAAKQTNVAHGITTVVETDTFAWMGQVTADSGGLLIGGATQATIGLHLRSLVTTTDTGETATDESGAILLRAADANGTGVQDLAADDNLLVVSNNATSLLMLKGDGQLNLQQDAADTYIMHLRSATDIAHGMTDILPTDVYAGLSKHTATTGGLLIRGMSEDVVGLQLLANATNIDSGQTATSETAAIMLGAQKKNAAGLQNLAASDNLLTIQNGTTNLFYVRGDGQLSLQQGTADTNILQFRSEPDVATGMTDHAPTDVFGYGVKHTAADGGLRWHGITQGTVGMELRGSRTTADSGKSSGAENAAVVVRGDVISGTGSALVGQTENLLVVANNGNARLIVDGDGAIHNVMSTANANMHFRNDSGVAHAFTDFGAADVFCLFQQLESSGGLRQRVFNKGTADTTGFNFEMYSETEDVTDPPTTALPGAINFSAAKTDAGTGAADHAAAAILFTIQNRATTIFALQAEGQLYLTNGTTAALPDAYDDVHLARAFMKLDNPRGVIENHWDQFITENADTLVDVGVLSTDKRLMHVQQLHKLECGAIWQLYERIRNLEHRLETLGCE